MFLSKFRLRTFNSLVHHKKCRYYTTSIEKVFQSMYPTVTIPETPVWSFLEQNMTRSNPNKLAYINGPTGEGLSHQNVKNLVDTVSFNLRDVAGVKKGDTVALCMPNSIYYPVIFYSILKLGATACLINNKLDNIEMNRQIQESGARIVFCDFNLLPNLNSTLSGTTIITNSPHKSNPNMVRLPFFYLM
eukprot:TRINITY_DN6573_c0_g1_i1.p1 TRINITY_DN6573_c0_g1~~TRINITY_DN6573_c0_g1_i1.p1  ORF type:complete len:189 (+),score=7.75 TRINITY_DN6573_c0_g1_i1:274-840(+)